MSFSSPSTGEEKDRGAFMAVPCDTLNAGSPPLQFSPLKGAKGAYLSKSQRHWFQTVIVR